MRPPRLLQAVLHVVLRLILIALFLGIPAALAWARIFGIGFGLPERIGEILSTPTFETRIGRLSFDPFRGLVAEDLQILRKGQDHKTPVADVSRLAVSLNLAKLVAGHLAVDRVSLDDSSAEIPVTNPAGASSPVIAVRGLKAEINFLGDKLHLTGFEADIEGIQLRGSGYIENPVEDAEAKPSPGGGPPRAPTEDFFTHLQRAQDILRRVNHLGPPPRISFAFHAKAGSWDTLEIAPLAVRAGPLEWEDWRVESLEIVSRFSEGRLTLEKCEVRDRMGLLQAWGTYTGRMASFEMESTLDPRPAASLGKSLSALADLEFQSPPWIILRGRADFRSPSPLVALTGAVSLEAFKFRGASLDAFGVNFAWKEGKLFLRDGRALVGGRPLNGDVLLGPEIFRLRASSAVLPNLLAPVLDEKTRQILSLMQFRDAPRLAISLEGSRPNLDKITGTGALRLGRTAMRGSWIDRADSALEIRDGAVTYRNFSVWKDQGKGQGTFIYDFRGRQVRLENIVSTLDPAGILLWADAAIADSVRPYRFHRPPLIKGGGVIHMEDLSKNNLSLSFESDAGLDYDLLGRTLNFGRVSGTIEIPGAVLRARARRAALLGGEVHVTANISMDRTNPVFDVDAEARGVDFPQLTKLYFDFDTSKGTASGRFKFSAPTRAPHLMRGVGSLRVENGNVFAIPLLGPLSDIINKVIPGAGYETARLATCDFQVADKRITSKNLTIEGRGFSLYGAGKIFFMTGRLDMGIRINARGLPGIVLFPVSKLLEYVSTGTLTSPEWRPKIIPRLPTGAASDREDAPGVAPPRPRKR